MGLSRAAIAWLIDEAERRPFAGSLLTLGVQNVFLSPTAFEDLAARRGIYLRPKPPDLPAPLVPGTVTAHEVFLRLGFDRVVTTDVDGFEGADFLFDLNAPNVPDAHRGVYDMVLDAGTLEHVFHLPNAFQNALAFAKPGGRVVHQSPSSNHIDHGFYMFSPTLFWDFYTANGCALPRFDLFRYRFSITDQMVWDAAAYQPGSLGRQMFGGLGGGCFGVALVVETPEARLDFVIPQQGMYAAAWSAGVAPGMTGKSSGPALPLRRVKAAWKDLRARVARRIPEGLRLRWRAARRSFPLKNRRRY